MKKTLEDKLKSMPKRDYETLKKQEKRLSKPLIKKGNLTSADIILKSEGKRKYIIHFQRHSIKEPKMNGELIPLTRNKDKVIFWESEKEDMMYTQVSCYANKPFQFMIVNGEKYIIMPFDKAFMISEALNKYLDFVRGIEKV